MAIDVVVTHAAGLDIAKASLVACVRIPTERGGWQVHKRKFTTMTADLGELAGWLAAFGVTRVGMESTSSYWKPVVRHEARGSRVGVRGLHRWSVAAGR